MEAKQAKPAPTELPQNIYEMYDLLGYSEPYENESEHDFKTRQFAFESFKFKLVEAGFTIDHLAGVLDPVIVHDRKVIVAEPSVWTM